MYSCSIDKTEIKIEDVYISNFISHYDTNYYFHSDRCEGFLIDQFDPGIFKQENLDKIDEIELKNLTSLQWDEFNVEKEVIDFIKYYEQKYSLKVRSFEGKNVFLLWIINSVVEKDTTISIGSDDSFKFWLNGKYITGIHKGRGFKKADNIVDINLNKGLNSLLFKIEQGVGDYKFYYEFIPKIEKQNIIKSKVADYYSDLLEACLIDENTDSLKLNHQDNFKEDLLHIIRFEFKNLLGNNKFSTKTIKATDLIKNIPNLTKDRKFLLSVKVVDENESLIYEEDYPIFEKIYAQQLAEKLVNLYQDIKNPILASKRNVVSKVFKIGKYSNDEINYSSRIRAQSLYELFLVGQKNESIHSGSNILGYRSQIDSSIQLYKVFIPPNSEQKKLPILFIIDLYAPDHPNLKDELGFDRSHFSMKMFTKLATKFNTIIVCSHGRGELRIPKDEIPSIIMQLKKFCKINDNGYSFFTTSNGANRAINYFNDSNVSVKNFGVMGGDFSISCQKFGTIIKKLSKENHEFCFYVRHTVNDKKVPIGIIRKYIQQIDDLHIKLDFKETDDFGHEMRYEFYLDDFMKRHISKQRSFIQYD